VTTEKKEAAMSETPGNHLGEEPQSERGPAGSRGTGSDEPSGGPVGRPEGQSDEESDTSVDSQGAPHDDAPDMPAGDQGG
jgi:hypothetical protein